MDEVLIAELPQAQRLALSYAPRRAHRSTLALLALDARLGAILKARREPLLTQMRLAWWRDMLARPPADWPGGNPVLAELAHWRDPTGLIPLVDGWEALLGEELSPAAIDAFAGGRVKGFAVLAGELGADGHLPAVLESATVYALADLAGNLSDSAERALVMAQGRHRKAPRLPRSLRPLAVLGALGEAALARGGGPLLAGPRSLFLALRIGLAGR